MIAKWIRALFVLLLVMSAAPQLARADVQQYVVVYVELLPGSEAFGERILDQLAASAHAAGALRFYVYQ
jgi:hypothetical protein